MALDARIATKGPSGERDIAITDLHCEPGSSPSRENTLLPGELIVAVKLPHTPFAGRSLYLKVRDRTSYEFALASAAVAAEMKDGKFWGMSGSRWVGWGLCPWRSRAAEDVLRGRPPTEMLFAAAADAALYGALPRRHNAFKVPLAKKTLVAALQDLTQISSDEIRAGRRG